MESGFTIISRLASLNAPQVKVDGMGHPVPDENSFNQAGRISAADIAGQSSQMDLKKDPSSHTSKNTKGTSLSHAAGQAVHGLVSGIGSMISGGSDGAMAAAAPTMTSNFGIPIADATHALQIGGHPVVSDIFLFEKQQAFNRAKIVERAVHACGSGAFGYFEVTNDLTHLCKAAFISSVGKQTPLFARFSTVTYGREFPDSARNPRGLAWKLYTEEGNYDILTVNFPSFFVRDPLMGPDTIRSQQRHPASFSVDFDSIFDFMSLVPESQLTNLWFWSDHGHPVGWRYMDSYPIHTFRWVNAAGQAVWVRYKIVSKQGIKNFTNDEAVRMCGEDPDFAKRDMFEHIEKGGTAEWTWYVQTMSDEVAKNYYVDPFDPTKRWNEADCPLMELGRIVVNRNPENFHRDVEQAAFSPGRLVPGIEPSPDPLLQWRLVFYGDAQMYRLGVNYHQIPVNCPFMAKSYHPPNRDGKMRMDTNGGAEAHYFPNSFTVPPPPQPDPARANWKMEEIHGVLGRYSSSRSAGKPVDEYIQAREFFEKDMTPQDRQNLMSNIAFHLGRVQRPEVQARFLICMYKVSPTLAQGIIEMMKNVKRKIPNAKEISFDQIAQLAASMDHASIPEQSYLPRPISL